MKEEIINLMSALKSGEDIEGIEDCAEEIADHYRKFIMWLVFEQDQFYDEDMVKEGQIWLDMEKEHKCKPGESYFVGLDDVYNHWVRKVKDR